MNVDLSNKEQVNQAGGEEQIALPLLQLITEARNEHGMRQQDFTRYRQYCATKVHRLRETLNLTHSDGTQKLEAQQRNKNKNAKAKKSKKRQTAADQSDANKGKGNVFTPQTLCIEDFQNQRPVLLLLFEAERAWAYSQELRNQAFENDADPALRKRGISRLRRAVQWSTDLYEVITTLSSRFDIYARAEAAAYSIAIKGITAFDRAQWEKALQHLSVARTLLNVIAENSKTSRAEALANSFVDAGEAQLRYCAYQLGQSEQNMDTIVAATATVQVCQEVCGEFSKLVEELEAAKAQSGAGDKKAMSLSWHGHQIPVRNAELLDIISHAQAEEATLREIIQSGDVGQNHLESNKKSSDKASKAKRPRLSHAQRKAKKRELAQTAVSSASQAGPSTLKLDKAGRTELDPFDRALSALTDAEEVARRLVEDNREALSKSHSARYETASQDLQTAHDYIFYRLLALRIWRNFRMVAEVERKSEKRDKRAIENVETRLAHRSGKRTLTSKKAKAKREQAKPAKPPKKNQPGSRAKRPRSTARTHHRRAARSGTRSLQTRRAAARVSRARALAAQKSRRRSARAVPSLAKLLDGAETSLSAMASISLIESEPDVSSLVEAKAAWYRSELLRHLARAFALSNARGEAILLITRAQLYVRQARQAAELAESVEEEDADFPPAVHGETAASIFDRSEENLANRKREVQKELYRASFSGRGKSTTRKAASMSDSKAGQALQEIASKYVRFDPVDLADAERIPDDVAEECQRELNADFQPSKPTKAVPPAAAVSNQKDDGKKKLADDKAVHQPIPTGGRDTQQQPPQAKPKPEQEPELEPKNVEGQEQEEEEEEAGNLSQAYDPGNALAEEEEARLQAETTAGKKGWFGKWF